MSESRQDQSRSPNRRLGRGLGSLLAVPIAVPSERSAPQEIGAVAVPAKTVENDHVPASSSAVGGEAKNSEPSLIVLKHKRMDVGVPRGTEKTRSAGPADDRSAVSVGVAENGAEAIRVDSRSGMGEELHWIEVGRIEPNPRQPRQDFSEVSLQSLAESIRRAGLMQPLVVRPTGDSFQLIAGERRWRAARSIGLPRVPAIVRNVDDQTAAEWALIENVQREDLNPIERSSALRALAAEFGLTHQDLADRVGLDRTSVTNLLRLGELDPFTTDAVRKSRLSMGHAKALLAISDVRVRHPLAAAAMAGDWSVRELERRVRHSLEQSQLSPASAVSSSSRGSSHVADLEKRLGEHLGSRVSIQLGRKKGTGRVVVEFYSLDQFDGLLAKLGFPKESL